MNQRKSRWFTLLFSIVVITIISLPNLFALEKEYQLIEQLMSKKKKERRDAVQNASKLTDLSMVPGMVDALFFVPKRDREELVEALVSLTGEKLGTDYYAWVELVGRRTDLKPRTGYVEWKSLLLSRIDPEYKKILYPGVPSRIRIEEIVWGGVKLGGIPSLERPPRVKAIEAKFLDDDEEVFALSVGNEHHAYPLRYLSWHEMANDVVGNMPITLSF